MDNSSEQDEETILAVDTEGQSKQKEENCRQEIEDIVRGFLIEKDVMAQSHEEEINRMKQRFDLERRQLLELLKIDRGQMVSASRISESATVLNAEGHFAAAPEVLISDAGRTQSLTEALMDEQNRLRNGSDRGLNGGYDMDEVDSSLIREIAEVYLRINNSALTSQMRPELDLEDKFEREKEVLERSFQLEKREMRRRLEEECHQKMEQERMKYEASIAELKATVSELQWQKREADNRIKHEKEKWEMTVEREKNDTEKRHAQFIHDVRRKLEDKHGGELEKQREKYEENISDLQSDISKLTMQLKELNESLNYEKEMIMNKFDREVKEMEQAFLEQRISLKETLEAEFLVRLGHETSLLKAINSKLKEDLENTEKEKKVVERKGKEEKRKLEERFDDEITELEQRQSHEKRTLKTKLEERHQMELARQKGELEDTIQELSEEIALLKDENMQMGINFAERRDELQRRLDMEREGMQRKLENEMDTMRHRIEKELSDRLILEKVTQGDTIGQHKREVFMIQAKYDELQMQMAAMRKEREVLLRERENLLKQRNDGPISGEALDNSVRINDMLREKDNELANIKFENQQLEMTLSAVRREKGDLEDELANLRRLLPSDSSAEEFADIPRNNREMTPFQELFKRKEGELALLHKEKLDLANRLSTLERKNEQLEYEIANSTSKKLQVEDEISALKREKTDSENQVALLKRDKAELEELVTQLKKMRGELEDSMSTIKRANTELEHEISNLKRQNSTLEIEIHRQFEDQLENSRTVFHKHEHEHVTRENNSPGVTDERNGPRVMEIHSERQVASLFGDDKDINDSKLRWDTKEMQRMVTDLKKQKDALESDVKRLNNEKTDLENDLRIQLEDQRKLLQQERDVEESGKRDDNRVLKKQNDDLERKTGSLRKEQIELQDKVSQHKKDLSILSEKLNKSRDEQNRITQEIRTLKQDKYSLEKVVLKANRENGNAQKEHESPRNRTERDRVGNGADEEIYALRSEKDELQRELAKVKHQYMLIQKEISTRTIQDTEEPLKMKEEEISELQMIHAQLEKEILVFMTNKTQLEAEISTIQDYVRQEENELENLKRERMELELHITALQSRNTRLKAEGSVLKDQMHMDEIEVDRLRNEKADLEKDVFNLQIKMLQSENTALEVYGSAPKDEYQIFDNDEERTRTNEYMFTTQNNSGRLQAEENHSENEIRLMQDNYKRLDVESFYLGKEERGDDNDVDTALRVKDELEKDVLSLQSEKRRLETEISFAHNAWEAKKSEIASLQGNVQEITDQMESLTKQKKELQFEVMKIQTSKELEHAEFNELQRRKSDLEIQLTEISIENDNRGQNTKLDLTEPDNNDEERWRFTSDYTLSTEEQLGTIKQKLQLEITRLQKPKNEEGDDLNLLQQQKTELEISTGDLQTKKHQMEKATLASEQCEVRRDWDQSCYYSDDEKQQFGNSGFSAVERKQEFNTSNSHDSVSREMYHTTTSNFDSSINYDYDSQVRGIQPSQEATTSTSLNSSESLDDVKDNNQMIALKREKSDLEGQIYVMMVRLTQLQTEVTELENKKTILEALRGTNSSDEMTTDMANAYEADPDFSTPGTIVEDKKDNLIREYEKQIRELKQTKIEMEQKIGLLEWQLENMKQKLDIQEICHRREISTLSEKTLSFNGFHGNNKQDDILQEFHQKLSYFLMSGEHSNKEIMEEIETQILKLQEKVHSDKKNAQDQFTSRTVELEKDKPASASKTAFARNYANQLKAQMETAENQLKSCEKVIHRLYGENADLTKQSQGLEGKLKSASQSQEKLQRKKVHLQKLVEKLSNHMGKDALQQSYFVFELDEDVSA